MQDFGESVAVGKIDETESDQADQQMFDLDIRTEFSDRDPVLDRDVEVLHRRIFGQFEIGAFESAAAIQVFPKKQIYEFRILLKERKVCLDQLADHLLNLVRFGEERDLHVAEALVDICQSRLIEFFLASEVVINHPFIYLGGFDDFVDSGSGKTFFGKFCNAYRKETVLGALRFFHFSF